MKLVLLDYLRRKWWIMAFGAIMVAIFGASFSQGTERKQVIGALYQFAFFTAALPLSLDLQQGVLRVSSLLPLTARQLGRAWWWAGVGVPATLISLVLPASALLPTIVSTKASPNWESLAVTIISIWLWLGSAFAVLFCMRKDASRGWQGRARSIGSGAAWTLMIGGSFVFMRWVDNNTGVQITLLVIGVLLTAFGWARAGDLVAAQAGARIAVSPASAAPRKAAHQAEKGGGGLAYLVTRNSLRAVLIGMAMLLLMPLMIAYGKGWEAALNASADMNSMPFLFVFIFSVIPALVQLRFLRTLPVSASQLTLALLTMLLAPCCVLAAINVLCTGAASGWEAAFMLVAKLIVTICPLTLVLPLALWRGFGRVSYILMIVVVIGAQTVPIVLHIVYGRRVEPDSLLVVGALLIPVLAFFLSRLALERGSKAYRAQTLFFTGAWAGGAR